MPEHNSERAVPTGVTLFKESLTVKAEKGEQMYLLAFEKELKEKYKESGYYYEHQKDLIEISLFNKEKKEKQSVKDWANTMWEGKVILEEDLS